MAEQVKVRKKSIWHGFLGNSYINLRNFLTFLGGCLRLHKQASPIALLFDVINKGDLV